MYEFSNAVQLLELCRKEQKSIPEVALLAEVQETGQDRIDILSAMDNNLMVMEQAIKKGLEPGIKSVGGLIGGNAYRMHDRLEQESLTGKIMLKAVSYALAVTEVNAAMGQVVAAPTAGASGILPGMLVALKEERDYPREKIVEALLFAAAIGKIIAINATLSGAEGGCQAECGSASAMAAASAVYLAGGSNQMCFDAAAMALKGLLGLICDPVAGLVEVPCSKRNASSVANSMICAEMALAGIRSFIPFDEVVEAMARVGRAMSPDFRETAQGGCAITPTALKYARLIQG